MPYGKAVILTKKKKKFFFHVYKVTLKLILFENDVILFLDEEHLAQDTNPGSKTLQKWHEIFVFTKMVQKGRGNVHKLYFLDQFSFQRQNGNVNYKIKHELMSDENSLFYTEM